MRRWLKWQGGRYENLEIPGSSPTKCRFFIVCYCLVSLIYVSFFSWFLYGYGCNACNCWLKNCNFLILLTKKKVTILIFQHLSQFLIFFFHNIEEIKKKGYYRNPSIFVLIFNTLLVEPLLILMIPKHSCYVLLIKLNKYFRM